MPGRVPARRARRGCEDFCNGFRELMKNKIKPFTFRVGSKKKKPGGWNLSARWVLPRAVGAALLGFDSVIGRRVCGRHGYQIREAVAGKVGQRYPAIIHQVGRVVDMVRGAGL